MHLHLTNLFNMYMNFICKPTSSLLVYYHSSDRNEWSISLYPPPFYILLALLKLPLLPVKLLRCFIQANFPTNLHFKQRLATMQILGETDYITNHNIHIQNLR